MLLSVSNLLNKSTSVTRTRLCLAVHYSPSYAWRRVENHIIFRVHTDMVTSFHPR